VLRRGTIAALGVVSAAAVASTAIVLGSSSGGSIDVIVGGTPTAVQTANCFPDPSACGYPDLDGTTPVGVQAGHTLTPVNDYVTLSTNGQVYQDKEVTGQIRVTANNVTIRNVKLISTDNYYGVLSQGSNLTVEHTEITRSAGGAGTPPVLGDASGGDFYAIGTQNYTAKWVYVHNLSDCFGLSGVGIAINVTIQDSLCAVGLDSNNNGWPDGGSYDDGALHQHTSNGLFPPSPATPAYCYDGTPPDSSADEHFDGLQSDGGSNITLTHNTVRNPCSETSAINMSSNTANISNVTISNNLIAGGGYTLYCAGINDISTVTNETVTDNRVSRAYWSDGGYYGTDVYCTSGFADIFTGNVYDENNLPI
jgi:hypothetical protein